MHNAERPAKASADERLASYKQSVLAVFGAEKAEAVGQALELLANAVSAVVAAQGFIPFATIEKVAHAMGNAALALPVATIMERARIFQSLAADREKYEATEQVPWPSEQTLLVNVVCETWVNLAIAREAIGVWSGMFNKPRIPLKSSPYSVEEARAAIRELIAPIEETLRTTGSALSRFAELGIQNEDGRDDSTQSRRDQSDDRASACRQIAAEIMKANPGIESIRELAKQVEAQYRLCHPSDEKPPHSTNIRSNFLKGIKLKRGKKRF